MNELHDKLAELEHQLEELSAPNHKAIALNRELETLAESNRIMEQELMLHDVNTLARPRVEIIQSAVIEELE